VELGFLQLKHTSISQDNSGCVASAHNVHFRGHSKHVALRVCFIEQLIQDGIISANQCPTTLQIPDIGTKALSREPFESLTDQLLSDRHVGSKWVSFGPSYVWERIRPVSYRSIFMLRTEVRNYLPR